ncbi:M13 family metallopeptidase [Aeromicrobium duanguangcaii]|uniref:Peptidase M13 n=1 Tax=Aeromicrobium duanguangcaii TaxID=2968086 RepID=A0ABY5KK45_9ACTN|nr:M13-type metalloendopeptidase [Aeromicrobium duanguangcaii]MCD9153544.1 peptidase M13 [Aeromicrobium duanguangcaii]MCL3836471.1 peptidase M13 [Aeromicrobium duanguangcaii]UUI69370.1 peptidase M13 [Aeromicrobium duanguangcaii]
MSNGLDPTTFDSQTRVQDDLFRYVNGPWLREAPIKPDRATAGGFIDLVDEAEELVRTIVERCAAEPQDDEERKIGDLFTSFMDTERIEQLGAAPLTDDLARIDAVTSIPELVRAIGALERSGVDSIAGLYIAPDRGRPDRYVTHVVQSGIGLPDESYYREDQFAEIREAYRAHIATMLSLAGFDEADQRADRALDIETRIASHHWDRVACRDAQKTYNLMTLDQLDALTPAFDWRAWADEAGIAHEVLAEAVVSQPSYLEGVQTLLTDDLLPGWLDWLRWQLVHGAAPFLSDDFVAANFEFYGKTLQGTDELRPRWKRGIGFVEGSMGEAVGKIYVRTEYPAEAKSRMEELIANLLEAYRISIRKLPWMSDETKQRALDKLDSFTPKIGHPEKFKDYSALETDPGDLVGNTRRAQSVAMDRELAKIGKPIDRDEWYMTPQTVNAYYNPTMNEIVFPAAILQPPFFDAQADDAVNYGAIGSVIGHEIGHGFDDQGSQYDGTGALSNWWTDDDRAAFDALAAKIIAQYDDLSPANADGQTVNGALTIGENIGDLGGLGIAYLAFKLAQQDKPAEPIDGFTPDQRFFLSWARAWQGKSRPAETLRRLTVDPHSPPEFRCNQVVRNIEAFYDAFDVTPDDALWLDPAERVTIWA